MNALEKMAQIINYISEKYPMILLDKKWNWLLRDMLKELETMEYFISHEDEKRCRTHEWQAKHTGFKFCPDCGILLDDYRSLLTRRK